MPSKIGKYLRGVTEKRNEYLPRIMGRLGGINTKQKVLLTDVLNSETVILVEIGDVLAAELHAVRGPNRRVVTVKEALSVGVDVLRTLFPFTGWRAEREKAKGRAAKNKINNPVGQMEHFLNLWDLSQGSTW